MSLTHWQSIILALLLACVSACVSTGVRPENCPSGTQPLAGCPPLGAVADPEIAALYKSRTWRSASDLGRDPVEFGRDAKIPINQARAKFIGSTDEGGLTSLAAKIHLIQQASHTVDVMYYIFSDDLVGLAMLGALCDAVERGIDVRIMVDSLGSGGLNKTYLRALESCALNAGFIRNEAGQQTIYRARVQTVIFNAISKIFVNFNRRSHDKLLVVDGWFPDKAAVMTGGRNMSLDYYGILADGTPNPNTYRDAEILLRGGESVGERRESVGSVSEVYYTLIFLFKNNKRLEMTRLADPALQYASERQELRDSLSRLLELSPLADYFAGMPAYLENDFRLADVRLAHELANLTDTNVVNDAVENTASNPNSIMTVLAKIRETPFARVQIVSPYLFAALYKDKDGNVIHDDAANILKWLEDHPDSTIDIVTNSVLTSDNFFAQAVIDMDLVPRLLLTPELQSRWLQKPALSELDAELVGSDAWQTMMDHPRLHFYQTGQLNDVSFGGDYVHAKLHAKYTVSDDMGFIGTTNFDYRSRLYNNEMGFFFRSEELADDLRANSAFLQGIAYRWGSPEWLEMRRRIMEQKGVKASTTRDQRSLYKTLKNTGLQWFF